MLDYFKSSDFDSLMGSNPLASQQSQQITPMQPKLSVPGAAMGMSATTLNGMDGMAPVDVTSAPGTPGKKGILSGIGSTAGGILGGASKVANYAGMASKVIGGGTGKALGTIGSLVGKGSSLGGSAVGAASSSVPLVGLATAATGIYSAFSSSANLNARQKRMARADGIASGIESGLMATGNPILMGVGLGLKVIDGVGGSLMNNSAAGKAAKDFTVNDQVQKSSAYTGTADQATEMQGDAKAFTKAGLFGKIFTDKTDLTNSLKASEQTQNRVKGVLDQNKLAIDSGLNSQDQVAANNKNKLYNSNMWNNGSVESGKRGLKFIRHQQGGVMQRDHTQVVPMKLAPANQHTGSTKDYFDWLHKKGKDNEAEAMDQLRLQNGSPSIKMINYRSNYDAKTNTMNVDTTSGFHKSPEGKGYVFGNPTGDALAELAHAVQFHNNYKVADDMHKRDNTVYPNSKAYDDKAYNDPKSLEYQAHTTIQPQLQKKLNGYLMMKEYQRGIKDGDVPLNNRLKLADPVDSAEYAKSNNAYTAPIKYDNGGVVSAQQGAKLGMPKIAPQIPGGATPMRMADFMPERSAARNLTSTVDAATQSRYVKDSKTPVDGQQANTPPPATNVTSDIMNMVSSALAGYDPKQQQTAQQQAGPSSPVDPNTLPAMNNGGVVKHANGGPINVIVEGALHARKHSLKEHEEFEDANITNKGVPVVSKDGGEIEQHAEVERDELILHYDLTKQLEALAEDGSEEAAIEAGKLLAQEIVKNTKDSTSKILKNA